MASEQSCTGSHQMDQSLCQTFGVRSLTFIIQVNTDIISRLPGCAGQAADAVSAYTQVKMEDDPKLLKIPKSECPDIWIRLPRHKRPKSWSSMEDPVVPLEQNLYCHPLEGLLWEGQFEKIILQRVWEKVSNWECLFVHRQKGVILICVCGGHKIGWKEAKS